MAGLALAAGLVGSSGASHRRKKKKSKRHAHEYDAAFVLGLQNTGNSCFLNVVLQALAALPALRSYLAELTEPGDDLLGSMQLPSEDVRLSVAYTLYRTIEALNKPLNKPHCIVPSDIVDALERKSKNRLSRHQQDAHELFQLMSSILSNEEEDMFKEKPVPLLSASAIKLMAAEKAQIEKSDVASNSSADSIGTMGTMYSSFSISTLGGYLPSQRKRPRNPFTGLAASKVSCLKCGYTGAIRHHVFDNLTLNVPQQLSCTLEDCLSLYIKIDMLDDYQCRKCGLLHTLNLKRMELERLLSAKSTHMNGDARHGADTESSKTTQQQMSKLESDIAAIEENLRTDIERDLLNITITYPQETSRTSKQSVLAKPPKDLCLHLSRSIFYPSGHVLKNNCKVTFPEILDVRPFTTDGHMPTKAEANLVNKDEEAEVASPSSKHNSFASMSPDGLNIALENLTPPNKSRDTPYTSRSPSQVFLAASAGSSTPLAASPKVLPLRMGLNKPPLYRLQAVIVHSGLHNSGHFVTYRRKKVERVKRGKIHPDVQIPTQFANGKHRQEVAQASAGATKFWAISDEDVCEVGLDEVLRVEPYMLFYERI
ncbi:hypothetical protein BZG36_02835 [Bifiguratus adelaidae]|uniref:Ubiquitin carboxyl-terminal hydrolase n=1 Tax=Bifiguratus adelaidae TaxID=1938954 RepID=A0A261Y0I6_9FUNG|nr:hypothetical protein BZG36_02835 [Bifiguratus adelaidae]